MPELPEVERGRQVAERTLRGRRIMKVICPDDPIMLDGTTPRAVRAALRGATVCAVHRYGKHLWFETDRSPWLLVHFGMTGSLHGIGPDDADFRFVRLTLVLEDRRRLVFSDPRRFGRVRLRDDPMHEAPIAGLGFDPLLAMPDARRFASLLRERRAPIKALLLDQTFAAGVGNWIADEALYQARIDPRRRACDLDDADAKRLRMRLHAVIVTAVRHNADKSRFPRSWLFHHRWGKRVDATSAKGELIEHLTVGGRTTAWVPSVQR